MSKYIILLWLLSSCATPKKLHRMLDKLPEAAAKECAERYPVRESIDSVIVIDSAQLKAYESEFGLMATRIDSLLSANCDTVTVIKISEIIKRLPAKIETKVITRTIENTARHQVLRDSIRALTQTATQFEIKAQNLEVRIKGYRKQVGWMWVVILLLAALLIKSFVKL